MFEKEENTYTSTRQKYGSVLMQGSEEQEEEKTSGFEEQSMKPLKGK